MTQKSGYYNLETLYTENLTTIKIDYFITLYAINHIEFEVRIKASYMQSNQAETNLNIFVMRKCIELKSL